MGNTVIVIRCGEDGDTSVERMPKAVFLERLKERYYGRDVIFAQAGTVPQDLDTFVGLIVIDGDVVVPRAVQFATKYKLS